jgi:hypothetical protein
MAYDRWSARTTTPVGVPIVNKGKNMAGTATVRGPRAALAGARSWHPTVVNLTVLIVLELLAYSTLRWALRQYHGG